VENSFYAPSLGMMTSKPPVGKSMFIVDRQSDFLKTGTKAIKGKSTTNLIIQKLNGELKREQDRMH
jgi:hypothetical protein